MNLARAWAESLGGRAIGGALMVLLAATVALPPPAAGASAVATPTVSVTGASLTRPTRRYRRHACIGLLQPAP